MTKTRTSNPIEQLHGTLARAEQVVGNITADQLSLPTPCHLYDVHQLAGHLLYAARRTEMLGRGEDACGGGLGEPTERPEWPITADLHEVSVRAVEAWWAKDLDETVTLPWAAMPAREVLATYVMELLAHAWDLAAATGQAVEGDEALGATVLSVAEAMIASMPPAAYEGDEPPFRRPTAAPEGAGPHSKLAALLGRTVDPAVLAFGVPQG